MSASAPTGGDRIDDVNGLRAGATGAVLGQRVAVPSAVGSLLRSLRWRHARQFDAVARKPLERVAALGAPDTSPAERFVVDIDATLVESYGWAERGAEQPMHTSRRGCHPRDSGGRCTDLRSSLPGGMIPDVADLAALLADAAARVVAYRARVPDAPVAPPADATATVRAALGSMRDGPTDAARVVDELVTAVEPGLVATTGPRYFGLVVGGALPAATAADVLAVGWDQPAFNAVTSPAAAVVEEVAGAWLVETLGLPAGVSVGFVTGGQGANTVGLAAARHRVLAHVGWDVELDGLTGAPPVRVVASVERHATIDRALRLLGLGSGAVTPVAADGQGRIDVLALTAALAGLPPGPRVVCLQAGNVNTGACDDLAAGVDAAHRAGAWVHVDGAFGLWAAASPAKRHLVAGLAGADSWATDGHKWLNVPYDSGYVFCADPAAHRAAMSYTAAYLTGHGQGEQRAPSDFVPESSRRARGFATWAALRELGRSGVADLVDRCCALARRFAARVAEIDGVEVCNRVVLNQVLLRFGDEDVATDAVVAAVQRSGEAWMGATSWHGRRLMRVSVSNATTTEADVDRAVVAVSAAWDTLARR